jgi:hypothetical protein
MTIRILKTEPFYPLGKPLPRPATDLVKKVDELIRPGVFRKADGTFETRGYEPPAEPSKPAAPKYRCDTCEDTGKCHGPIPVNGG